MGLVDTEAIVLRTYNLAEADKIVVCLTRSCGIIRGVARGSRRIRNRFGAALEPFTLVDIAYYQKESQELVSLSHAEILRSHFALASDAEALAGLAYMGDLAIEFSPPHQTNDHLFRMFKGCLEAISHDPGDLKSILRYFEVWILRLEGFMPDIKRCVGCQKNLAEAEGVFFSHDLGLLCRLCSQGRGNVLSTKAYHQLQAIQRLAPEAFARESRGTEANIELEIAQLANQIISRVLERQPRLRPTF
jgi:DNA repair protein RecO (recombination protein O)